MKIWALVENTALEGYAPEHGLSLYIEALGHRILFDMGQSGAFADNGEKLGIDLAKVDLAVISHGHYDHGGGLERFLQINQTAPVYISRHAFEPHFNAAGKDIGLDPAIPRQRIVFTHGNFPLAPGITLHSVPFLPTDTAGMTTVGGQPEDFRHEQYLLVEEAGKRILLSGCSHKGILELMERFRPDVLLGGFHFKDIPPESPELIRLGEALAQFDCTYYTGHCTGEAQFAVLKTILRDRLHPIRTGSVIEI